MADIRKNILRILVCLSLAAVFNILPASSNTCEAKVWSSENYLFETQVPEPPYKSEWYYVNSWFEMPSGYETLSDNQYKVYVDFGGQSDVIATAVRIGDNYYIEKINLDETVTMLNGNKDYVNNNVEIISVKKRKDRYKKHEDYNYDEWDYETDTHTIGPAYEIVDLNSLANLCGGKMKVSGSNITITVTLAPLALLYPEECSKPVADDSTSSIKVHIEVITFNLFNNDGLYVDFKQVEGEKLVPPDPTISISDKQAATPDSSGECNFKNVVTLTFNKEGNYRFSLVTKDGVGRVSPEQKISVKINKGTLTVATESGASNAAPGEKLSALETEYGIINYTAPDPSQRPDTVVPAGEEFLISTVKYTTYSPNGRSNAPRMSPSDVIYKIPVWESIKNGDGTTSVKLKIIDNSSNGNMVKVWEEEHWGKYYDNCGGKDSPCPGHPYVKSRAYIFRKIIKVPENIMSRTAPIVMAAKAGYEADNSPPATGNTINIYTPLRQTFQLTKNKDPKYDPSKPYNGQFIKTGP